MLVQGNLIKALTIASFLLTNTAFALSLDTNVDYWHRPTKSTVKKKQNQIAKQNAPPQSAIAIEIQKALTKLQDPNAYNEPDYHKYIKIIADNITQVPTSALEKLSKVVILDISKYQYENHIKATKPLVAYLYLKEPNKYKKDFWDWYTWKTQQVGILTSNMRSMATLNANIALSRRALIKWFNKHNIAFLFFCKPNNDYCEATMPVVKKMQKLGLHIRIVDVTTRPDIAQIWHVNTVPTLFALNPNTHEAAEYEGAFNGVQSSLVYFYQVFKERDNPLLYGGRAS